MSWSSILNPIVSGELLNIWSNELINYNYIITDYERLLKYEEIRAERADYSFRYTGESRTFGDVNQCGWSDGTTNSETAFLSLLYKRFIVFPRPNYLFSPERSTV